MKRLLLSLLCLLTTATYADAQAVFMGEYWVDDGYDNRTKVSIGSDGHMQFVLDGSALGEGLHRLNYRVNYSGGNNGPLQTWLFYRQSSAPRAQKTVALEYWIDDNTDKLRTIAMQNDKFQFQLDASALPEGLHTLHYRGVDDTGKLSPLQSWLFFRYVAKSIANCTLEYWIDDNTHQSQPINDTTTSFVLDASALSEGLHTLNYQLKDEMGRLGSLYQWKFYCTPPIPGDVNKDKMVNVSDVTSVINFILGKDSEGVTIKRVDVNSDGIVNVSDVTMLINIILGKQ